MHSFKSFTVCTDANQIIVTCHVQKVVKNDNRSRSSLQMLLFPNALCCSLYERNCVCAVTKIFTKVLPANNFCQLLRVMRKRSCTSAGNAQAQLHFRDDQQRGFGISNIPNSLALNLFHTIPLSTQDAYFSKKSVDTLSNFERLLDFPT